MTTRFAEPLLTAACGAATGAQLVLSPRAALRVEAQQYLREHALDPKPTVGEFAAGLKVAF